MKSKIIKIPIYGGGLRVKKVNSWKKTNEKFGFEIEENWLGCVFRTMESGKYFINVFFKETPSIKTMVHESIHAVNDIFKYRHVKLDLENDENQAYFTEWVFEQVENYFEELELKKNG